jgi:hypothetical protein
MEFQKGKFVFFDISYLLMILGCGSSDAHRNVNKEYGKKTVSCATVK